MKIVTLISIVATVLTMATHAEIYTYNGKERHHEFLFSVAYLSYINPTKLNSRWTLSKQETPRYPMEFNRYGYTGCAIFKVTVNEHGQTNSVELISTRSKKFTQLTNKFINKWQWQNTSGQPNAIEGKIIRLDFCMGGLTPSQARSQCAKRAKKQGYA